ncbi:UNKNOWN [Stylonychia lemnae]|uniref:Transmembrane protein n=1 Tax=Stylonychia lemnae TaxID=5949 RepID=A0A077ZT75_STYLE|nr:UNKNOWN [Stylonychia lemnae]|eukprot:CDW72520.1 UNKNOWN [Stylonychia lemnae]
METNYYQISFSDDQKKETNTHAFSRNSVTFEVFIIIGMLVCILYINWMIYEDDKCSLKNTESSTQQLLAGFNLQSSRILIENNLHTIDQLIADPIQTSINQKLKENIRINQRKARAYIQTLWIQTYNRDCNSMTETFFFYTIMQNYSTLCNKKIQSAGENMDFNKRSQDFISDEVQYAESKKAPPIFNNFQGLCQSFTNFLIASSFPFHLSWIIYIIVISVWSVFCILLNVLYLPLLDVGYWLFLGLSVLSIFMRFHYKTYYYELRKIRNYINFMKDL